MRSAMDTLDVTLLGGDHRDFEERFRHQQLL